MKRFKNLIGILGILLWFSSCQSTSVVTHTPSAEPTVIRTLALMPTPMATIAATATPLPGELVVAPLGLALPEGAVAWQPWGDYEYIGDVAYSPDGDRIAVKYSNGVFIYDAHSLELQMVLATNYHLVRVAWSPDGERLAGGSKEGVVIIWDVFTGDELATFDVSTEVIMRMSWAPNGKQMVVGAFGGYDSISAKVLDAASGEATVILERGSARSHYPIVAWSPDGSLIASGCMCDGGRIWDATSGKLLFELEGYNSGLQSSWTYSIAWSPTGDRLAVGLVSGAGVILVYDPATGEKLATLTGHTSTIHTLAWSPNGKWLVSGSDDDTVRIWDMANLKEVRVFDNLGGIGFMALSPDGEQLTITDLENFLIIWDLWTNQVKCA